MTANSPKWLPSRREEQLAMANNWEGIISSNMTAWGIPAEAKIALQQRAQDAQNMLAQAQSMDRTAYITAQCKAAFDALTAVMRDIKNHYFLPPKLTAPDFISLGLKPHDTTPTPVPPPTAQAEADLTFPGVHLVQLKNIRAVTGSAHEARSDYGVRIYWGLSGPAREADKFRVASPPATGSDLPHSLFTRRKKELFDFDGESGNTVYFYLRFENSKGEAGPFGPMVSAVIP